MLTVVNSFSTSTVLHMSQAVDHLPVQLAYANSWVSNVARKQPYDLYIGRQSRGFAKSVWGNKHHLIGNSQKTRLLAVAAYANDILENLYEINKLTGLRLGCWCAPKLCHGHILAALANDKECTDNLFDDTCITGATSLSERAGLVSSWKDELTSIALDLPHRLLVSGSRTWTDRNALASAINEQWTSWGKPSKFTLIVGDADGADRIAQEIVSSAGFDVELHIADWEQFGRRAGMRRNAEMVASGADAMIACWDGISPGTRGCIDAAAKAGLKATLLSP